jgi:hypothetical protein
LVLYDHGLLVLDAHFDVRWQKYEFLLTYHLEKVKENTIWLVHNYADDLPALGYRVKDGAEVAS